MTARAVSNRVKCSLIERTPRAVLAIKLPIDANAIVTIESATRASISVKPAEASSAAVERNNLDSSRQPIDAHLVTYARARQRNDATARHSGGKESDRGATLVMTTTGR